MYRVNPNMHRFLTSPNTSIASTASGKLQRVPRVHTSPPTRTIRRARLVKTRVHTYGIYKPMDVKYNIYISYIDTHT